MTDATGAAGLRPTQVEMNGINVISESERKGQPRDLFWPWFAANISVLGLSYGSFELGYEPVDEPLAWLRALDAEGRIPGSLTILDHGQTCLVR